MNVAGLLSEIWRQSDLLEMKIDDIKQKASWNQGKTMRISVSQCEELLQYVISIKKLVEQVEKLIGLRRK